MKPPNHKYLFFTESHTLLFSSLQRYLNYILNLKLNPYSEAELNSSSSTILLVYQEERENPRLLNVITSNSNLKLVVIGCSSNSTINLIDFANLKNNFSSELSNIDSQSHQLLSKDELKEKLKNFFHSHGEDSLFEYLNWTIYYLREGPTQFVTKNISFQDYNEKFLTVGIKNWNLFKSRYSKYKYFIKLSNVSSNSEKLETEINEADLYIYELSNMNEEIVLKKNEKYFSENIAKVEKIIEVLNALYREFKFG